MPAFLRYLGHRLYTTWATFWFVAPFFATYPAQWVLSQRPEWLRFLHGINRGWAKFSIFMWGVPFEVVRESTHPVPQPCIYVANHGSYVDILVLFRTIPGFLNMMGKDSLAKVPLWGPLFGKTYITVNRRSVVSRGRAMAQARQALAQGRPLALFAEGTIGDKPGEELQPFMDGAFQLAIATGVPLVPVSMPLNHKFMPSVKGLRVRYAPLRIIFHEAIETKGLTQDDVPALKAKVAAQIADDFVPEGRGIPEPSRWR
ncbi:1-acyl-sn-glycerol-3-phosphate acyltransferase [Hymenobacter sp. HMF4947]|uniref:1-acyl-sn-glycerol-3-phosphate acyltransferase n=1 Tax=Hymenobacter ginkgonis TaxID=2682976 RepID=A0A7K1TII8_9BACT|nr:lysophospholipid acyltransferase family protein [Hymenobacter ginkgonis]MVN78217.1 1-acyl-sn-glycerol-3-phosphate acyltransferase [Hymenobacter ginkgonis]